LINFRFNRVNQREIAPNLLSGATVAVVALPLALGFGVTSGMSAAAGLTTAIIAGFVAGIFGGSKYQVSGPTGAMTVVLIPIVNKYGVVAIPFLGLIAGLMVLTLALIRAGGIINQIPWGVVEGFTVGIAAVIALQQLPLVLGVTKGEGDRSLPVAWHTLANAFDSPAHRNVIAIAILTLLVKFSYPKITKKLKIKAHIPASFFAIVVSTAVVKTLSLDLPRIGDIPRNIGKWSGGGIALSQLPHLLWPAFLIALLCAIESLLSARVADSLVHAPIDQRFQPNRELVGQGLATIAASLLGGMPATGAIARTSVNVRSHATSRLSSAFHSVVLLIMVFIAAPLVSQIPSAAIGAVLIGTSFRMLNPRSIMESLRTTRSVAVTLVVTAICTLAIDLIWGIAIGIVVHFAFTLRRK
jgi:SulP family sulfate permease